MLYHKGVLGVFAVVIYFTNCILYLHLHMDLANMTRRCTLAYIIIPDYFVYEWITIYLIEVRFNKCENK